MYESYYCINKNNKKKSLLRIYLSKLFYLNYNNLTI